MDRDINGARGIFLRALEDSPFFAPSTAAVVLFRTSPPSPGPQAEAKARMSEASSSVAQVGHDGGQLRLTLFLAPQLPPRTRRRQGQLEVIEPPQPAKIAEHCGSDNNRNRELDQALEILERTCECGNDKMLLHDGKLCSTCQDCPDLDARQRRR